MWHCAIDAVALSRRPDGDTGRRGNCEWHSLMRYGMLPADRSKYRTSCQQRGE
jgi:hypothetical protein